MNIKVLGSGCKTCHSLYDTVESVVKENNIEANVEYITDLTKLIEYGIMSVPAMIINEEVVSTGKELNKQEVLNLLKK